MFPKTETKNKLKRKSHCSKDVLPVTEPAVSKHCQENHFSYKMILFVFVAVSLQK